MHPDLMGQIARQHHDDLRRSAAHGRSTGVGRPRRPSIRNRAGWTLIHIGLRLASGSADA